MKLWTAFTAILLLHAYPSLASNGEDPSEAWHQGFDIQISHSPVPVSAGDGLQLRYELRLTNHNSIPLTLEELEVFDAKSGLSLHALEGEALADVIETIGGAAGALQIDAGGTAFVYLDFAVPSADVPTELHHRLSHRGREALSTMGGRALVSQTAVPLLGPPLRGTWAAVHHPSIARGHRRVVYAVGGQARIPGRHAIDWMAPGADPNGGRGAEVLAVADGRVTAIRDGVPEVATGAAREPVALSDAPGNYIVLDIGQGRFATYEHLEPDLLVGIGDRVRRGQPIGRVGSTGQASRAHLHFHLADSSSPLEGEGLPYILEGATVIGLFPDVRAAARGGEWRPVEPLALGPKSSHLPPPNSLIRFE